MLLGVPSCNVDAILGALFTGGGAVHAALCVRPAEIYNTITNNHFAQVWCITTGCLNCQFLATIQATSAVHLPKKHIVVNFSQDQHWLVLLEQA